MTYNELHLYLYVIIGVHVARYMYVIHIKTYKNILFKPGPWDEKGGKVKSFSKRTCKKCLAKSLTETF